ncbi:MAG: ABC transporter substrate-binding protein [Lachnospiraceae bacterium]|nr:ABC transporter substrate-binding protein [Lachnospiraceae bacterium]
MKRKCISILLVFCMMLSLFGCGKSQKAELTKVKLNEVAHSIFYAPMYVAIEEGYFEKEGIDLELITGFGADKTMTAVLSGEADIGFMGPETTVYTYNEGANDKVINFAQLTQRAGNFLVAREKMPEFEWKDLKGKTVLGGRDGGMPEMVFEYVLKSEGIDPAKDLTIDKSIDFGSTAAAFSGGSGDFSVEFEPGATNLEKEGDSYVVASLGVDSGYVPYTAFSAKESYIEKNPEIIQSFTNALQKGMDYVNKHSAKEIAEIIAPQFKDTDKDTISTIIERYKTQDTWKSNLIFSKGSYNLLLDILESSDMLSDRPPYKDLVTDAYAKEAVK